MCIPGRMDDCHPNLCSCALHLVLSKTLGQRFYPEPTAIPCHPSLRVFPVFPLRSRPYMCRLVHAALARTPRWLRFPLCSPVRPATSSVRALKQFGPGAARPHDKICEGRTVIGCRVLLGGMSGTIIGWLGGMQMQADLTRSCGSRATQRGE